MTSSIESDNMEAIPERNRSPWFYVLGCISFLALLLFLILCTVTSVYLVKIAFKPTEITWFVGLGTGSDENQLEDQQAVVNDFNASHPFIHLNLEVFPNADSVEKLKTEMADDEGPDIVGPASFPKINRFHGQWLDLTPYISPDDLKPYNPSLIKIYQDDQGQIALPFMVYPSALFYNTKLFDAAGLKYPPANYGDKYQMPDGSQVEWSWETLATVARLLTLDDKGLNVTQPGFDKQHIVHYGYSWNFETHSSYIGSYFRSGSLLAEDGKTAQIPAPWHAAWEWTDQAIRGDQPFMANDQIASSAPFNGNGFDSGGVAMTVQPSWYTCCVNDLKGGWDLAVMPSYQGKVGGRIDVDTFYIMKDSKHPKEAYQVLLYLLGDGAHKLTTTYSGMSARNDEQQTWIHIREVDFPWVTNWNAFLVGLDYPDIPPAERYTPAFDDAWTRGSDFSGHLFAPNFNLAAEEQTYLSDLNKIFAGDK